MTNETIKSLHDRLNKVRQSLSPDEVFELRSVLRDVISEVTLCTEEEQRLVFQLLPPNGQTFIQVTKILDMQDRYDEPYHPEDFHKTFDLPDGWVAGWLGDPRDGMPGQIYVGVGPDGWTAS